MSNIINELDLFYPLQDIPLDLFEIEELSDSSSDDESIDIGLTQPERKISIPIKKPLLKIHLWDDRRRMLQSFRIVNQVLSGK